MSERARFPNKFLIAGVAFLLAGTVLLLWTAGYLGRLVNLWPIVLIIVGIALLYLVFQREGPEAYVFLGTLATLLGVMVLLLNTVMSKVTLERIWPVFMTITGVSLLAYGSKKRGYYRMSLTIPAVAIIVLSVIFLPFSLDIIQRDFVEFVGTWWPALLIIVGVILVVTDIVRRAKSG
jgi:hypothetical protein